MKSGIFGLALLMEVRRYTAEIVDHAGVFWLSIVWLRMYLYRVWIFATLKAFAYQRSGLRRFPWFPRLAFRRNVSNFFPAFHGCLPVYHSPDHFAIVDPHHPRAAGRMQERSTRRPAVDGTLDLFPGRPHGGSFGIGRSIFSIHFSVTGH